MNKIARCLKNAELSYNSIDLWDKKNVVYKEFNNSILNIAHVYYYFEKDELYISIRGSDCFYDIIDDCDIFKTLFKEVDRSDVYVHSGFYTDFCEIKDYVKDIINSFNISKIYFSGHSKGSAISTLTSLYVSLIYKNIKIYNIGFGSPRVGCNNFVNLYNSILAETTYLIRTKRDLIPKLPIYGYYDISNQYIIDDRKLKLYNENDMNVLFHNFNYHKLKYYTECEYEKDKETKKEIKDEDKGIICIDDIEFVLVE